MMTSSVSLSSRRDTKLVVVHPEKHADGALAVPTPDHYLPLLYACALRSPGEPVATVIDGLEAGSLSMRSILVG